MILTELQKFIYMAVKFFNTTDLDDIKLMVRIDGKILEPVSFTVEELSPDNYQAILEIKKLEEE